MADCCGSGIGFAAVSGGGNGSGGGARGTGLSAAGFAGDGLCGGDSGGWGFDSEGVCGVGSEDGGGGVASGRTSRASPSRTAEGGCPHTWRNAAGQKTSSASSPHES